MECKFTDDKVNNLINTIKADIGDSLDKHLFDFDREEVIKEYTKSLNNLPGIYDSKVELVEETWETLYPNMAQRLAIMLAYENDEINLKYHDVLPDHAKIYPYKYKGDWCVWFDCVDEDGKVYRDKEWFFDGSSTLEDVIEEIGNEYYVGKNPTIIPIVSWELCVPRTYFNCYIKPVKPIEYITLDCIITNEIKNLAKRQEPLGEEFEKVLSDNLWDLYKTDTPEKPENKK